MEDTTSVKEQGSDNGVHGMISRDNFGRETPVKEKNIYIGSTD